SNKRDNNRGEVKEHEVNVVLGLAEHDGNTLYISQVTITQDGKIANHRRKIKPTMYEKILFGDGSAQSVYSVVQTPYGRLGSLNCWEHMQPWLKTHFYSQHPQIFVGAWPPFFPASHGGSSFASSAEGASRMTQFVAMEGGCFGLACSPVVSEAGAAKMKIAGFPWFKFPDGGFTTIYGRDGSALTPPVDPAEETIVYATISLDKIDEAKLVAGIVGN
ncbi:carbon-nitrogen hydrolase, partial [Marasmius fiardii PR-910]